MTIKSLNKFLKKHCPDAFIERSISDFKYKCIAVDISIYIFKYKLSCQDRWIDAFINFICMFYKFKIHPIFIYDSESPVEKEKTRLKRKESRDKSKESLYNLIDALEQYHLTGIIPQILIDHHTKIIKKSNRKNSPSLTKKILPSKDTSKDKSSTIDMKLVEYDIKKKQNYLVDVTNQDFYITKRLLKLFNIPHYDSPIKYESEKICCDLFKNNTVDAILSNDSDVLLYSCSPLTNLDVTSGICTEINYDKVLETLKINENQFVDFCIMCGTDYNDNIPKIGPESAFKLIKLHESIENIAESGDIDVSILNHSVVRQLVNTVKELNNFDSYYCKFPNYNELQLFFEEYRLRSNINMIKNSLKQKFIIN